MASTYENDLRLEEIGDGEQSGTWGATTNTNLELISEALSFGTEGITTNADSHTTAIADGASDPGRSLYLKYTGTLDSACTITITPAAVSKVWYIENGTSGSQSIIISCGSGANVTIKTGQTKIVYSDGSGAMAEIGTLGVTNLAVGGNIDVDGVTNLDAVDIDGAVQLDSTLTVGANDQGYDVTLYGDTAARNATWDSSADSLIFTDNTKAVFGTGSDASILFDGTDMKVGATAGHLDLFTSEVGSSVRILGSGESLAEFTDDGDVDLFHNGTLKMSTTATGISVAGSVVDNLARGSIKVGNSSGVFAELTKGAADTVLTSNGTDLSWAAAGGAFMGNVVTISNSGVTTLSAAQSGSLVNVTNAAAIIKLPVSAAGLFYGIRNSTTAETPIRANGNGVFVNSILAPVKVLETDGFVLIVGIDSTHWAADYDVQSSSTLVRYTNTTGNNNYSVTHTTSALTTGMAIFIFGGLPKMGYGTLTGNSGGAVYFVAGAAGAGYSEKLITSSVPSSLTISGDYVNTPSALVNNPGTAQKLTVAGTGTTMVSTPPQGMYPYTINPRTLNATGGSITGGTFNANGGQGRPSPGTSSSNADLRIAGGGGMGSPAGVGGRAYNGDSNAGTNYFTGTNTVWASNQASGQQKFSHAGGSGGNDGTATAGGAGDTKDSNAVAWTNYLGKEFFCPAGGASVRPTAQGYASNTYFGSDNPTGQNGPSGSNFGNTPTDLILVQGPGNRPLFTYTTSARGGNNFGNLGATPAQVVIIDLKG